jgi:hypothetical protein
LQRCLQLERALSVGTDLDWFSALVVAGGGALAILATAAVALPRLRPALGLAVLALAIAGLVGVEHVQSRFCPGGGETLGTCGRADEEWGPVLREPLLRFRADERARLVGRPVEAGGPRAEAAQTLESFAVSGLAGWRTVRWLVVGAWFLALGLLATHLRPAWTAPLAVATVGATLWAAIADHMFHCAEGSSDCYRGFLVTLAALASVVVWILAFAASRFVTYVKSRR